jgi:butyrate kinase
LALVSSVEPLVLVINPGSTSTRIGLYRGEARVAEEKFDHPPGTLDQSGDLWKQLEPRSAAVGDFLERTGIEPGSLDAVVGRGGLLRPVAGGTYEISESMLEDARVGLQGSHPSNLGCALAASIARPEGIPAYVVDPVSVDESEELAAYSGLAGIRRRPLSHALSVHACARRFAAESGHSVEEVNVVVAHLGGGISVCPVRGGRIVDANNAVSEGPFSPQRSGGLPLQELLAFLFDNGYSRRDLEEMTVRRGGLLSYLGTSDAIEVEKRIADGDDRARAVYQAMAYQIAKEIGAMATVLSGRIDAIVLTGGLARSGLLVDWIVERVVFIAPVKVIETEEMSALAAGALRVLHGETQASQY